MSTLPKTVPICESSAHDSSPSQPFELLNLHYWYGLAFDSIQKAHTHITAYKIRSPEGNALQDIYKDILTLCLEAMREASTAHLPEELASLLAFQKQELEWMMQRRCASRKAD